MHAAAHAALLLLLLLLLLLQPLNPRPSHPHSLLYWFHRSGSDDRSIIVWAVDSGTYAPLLDSGGSSSEGGGGGGNVDGIGRQRSSSENNFGMARRESNSSTDSLGEPSRWVLRPPCALSQARSASRSATYHQRRIGLASCPARAPVASPVDLTPP